MSRKLSDEQLDRIAQNLLRDFAPDSETLDEIAESPRLWWNVRNAIETEKARRRASFFARFRQPILAFGALAVIVCLGLAVIFAGFSGNSNSTVAERKPVQAERDEDVIKPNSDSLPNLPSKMPEISKVATPAKIDAIKTEPAAKIVAKNRNAGNSIKSARKPSAPEVSNEKREETKTDFIALSYAADADSGQVVRVKVPSSMMVSLGVKTTVEKESELVSAEVVIGDDGMARAIRFIR